MSNPTANTQVADKADRRPFFQARRLGHANIWVSDYEQSFHFYNRVVGFNEAYRQPDNKAVFVTNGNTHHDFGIIDTRSHYASAGQQPGLNHLGFELRNEVDLVNSYRRALAAGIQFSAVVDHDIAHSLYVKDPDGNEVELYADVVPDWRSVRSGIVTKPKPQYVPGVTSEPIAEEMFTRNPTIVAAEGAEFQPIRTSHASLVAENFEEMHEFYVNVVGLSVFFGDASSEFAVLRGSHGNGDIVLHRLHGDLTPGLHHVGVEISDKKDFPAERTLAALGVTVDSQIRHPARRAMTIFDRDLLRVQLFVNQDWKPSALAGLKPEQAIKLL